MTLIKTHTNRQTNTRERLRTLQYIDKINEYGGDYFTLHQTHKFYQEVPHMYISWCPSFIYLFIFFIIICFFMGMGWGWFSHLVPEDVGIHLPPLRQEWGVHWGTSCAGV